MIKIINRYEHRSKKKCKNWFQNKFLQANEQFSFLKSYWKREKKNRDIKLVITEVRKNKLKLSYNKFSDNLLAMELKKIKKKNKTKKNIYIFFNKPVYIGLSILEINKIVIFQF